MNQFEDILDVVHKSARKGTLLASCEPEVKELMRQIELFLANKKTESDVKLQTQLQQRDRELSLLRATVQERQQQIDRLRCDLSNSEHLRKINNSDHETQLLRLRSELNRLTKSYDKLKARRGCTDKHVDGALEGDIKSVKSLQESQCKELSLVKAHNQALQEELAQCRNVAEGKEQSLHRELTQHKEQAKSNSEKYQLLKSDYDKMKQAFEGEIKKLRDKIEFLSRQNKELQSSEADTSLSVTKLQSLLQKSESEKLQISREVAILKDTVEKKDSLIVALKRQYDVTMTTTINNKQQQIKEMVDELKRKSVTEKSLHDENARLRKRLEQIQQRSPQERIAESTLQQYRSELLSKREMVATLQDTVTHLQDQLTEATTPISDIVSPQTTPTIATPTMDHRIDTFQVKLEQLIEQHFKKIDESLKQVST